MARSIVLRFDAQCFDCGRSLPAGSSARWFGKGRVSCCGTPSTGKALSANRADVADEARSMRDAGTDNGSVKDMIGHRAADLARAPAPHNPLPPYLPNAPLAPLAQLARDTGVPVENLASGLSQTHVAILAAKTPNQRLLVRLASGARFIVPALHAAHVIRCVEESCVDKCRDVALLADGRE